MLFAAVIAFACLSRCWAGITRPFIERQMSDPRLFLGQNIGEENL
nr:MAG TPA: hypothetical protein [Caudoviricetes sp.]